MSASLQSATIIDKIQNKLSLIFKVIQSDIRKFLFFQLKIILSVSLNIYFVIKLFITYADK